MNEKIAYLMKSEGLTSSRFAEILEIQPSGVSHLLSGRNKPRYDLLQRILTRFPKINPDWLLLDSDQIYRQDSSSTTAPPPQKQIESRGFEATPIINIDEQVASPPPIVEKPLSTLVEEPHLNKAKNDEESIVPSSVITNSIIEQKRGKVVRVLLFYDDGTCEGFDMR